MQISIEEVGRALEQQRIARTRTSDEAIVSAPSAEEKLTPGQELRRVRQLAADHPDVREELVQSLKARIENGTYNVSGEEIADLMIRRAFADSLK